MAVVKILFRDAYWRNPLQLEFVERLKEKVQKENLWLFILLLLSSGPKYGYEMRKLIEKEFGFWSGNVTAYRVLYAMQKASLVKSEKTDPRRKYYKITPAGERELQTAKDFLKNLVQSAFAS